MKTKSKSNPNQIQIKSKLNTCNSNLSLSERFSKRSFWSEVASIALRHGMSPRGFGPVELIANLKTRGLDEEDIASLAMICLRHGVVFDSIRPNAATRNGKNNPAKKREKITPMSGAFQVAPDGFWHPREPARRGEG